MDIAFGFDGNYVDHARVAMESVIRANPGADLRFWLATHQVPEDTLTDLTKSVDNRCDVNVLDGGGFADRFALGTLPLMSYLSRAMYLRLMLPEALQGRVDRLLYLDSDTLCVDPLEPLFRYELDGAPIGAVPDAFTCTVAHFGGLPGYERLGLAPDAPYFNSGVLLIDVDGWLARDLTGQVVRYLADLPADQLRFPDQDGLNVATYGTWYALDGKWNNMRSWLSQQDDPSLRGAGIMHFAGRTKPWSPGFPPGTRRDLFSELRRELGMAPITYNAANVASN